MGAPESEGLQVRQGLAGTSQVQVCQPGAVVRSRISGLSLENACEFDDRVLLGTGIDLVEPRDREIELRIERIGIDLQCPCEVFLCLAELEATHQADTTIHRISETNVFASSLVLRGLILRDVAPPVAG